MFERVGSAFNKFDWMKEYDFQLFRSPNELFDYISSAKIGVAHDFETDTLNTKRARIVGYSCSKDDGMSGRYYPVSHTVGSEFNLPIGPVLEVLKATDAREDLAFRIWWNYMFDGSVSLKNFGWEPEKWDDAMHAVFIENTNWNEYNLKFTAERLLGKSMLTFDEVTKGRTFDMLHPNDWETIAYASSDAALEIQIFILPFIQKAIQEQKFTYDLERRVTIALREGMKNGAFVSKKQLEKIRVETRNKVAKLEAEIFERIGSKIDLQSPVALGRKLIEIGVPIKETTGKSGQAVTKIEVLQKYKRYNPAVELIIQWKELSTQDRNYISKLEAAVDHLGPLITFSFTNIGVPTGRMKAGGEGKAGIAWEKGVADINVQSLPNAKKNPYLPDIRAAIVANDPTTNSQDWAIVSIDYSQMELRIGANLSREPAWIKTFAEGGDIHLTNARAAYRKPDLDPKRSPQEQALRDKAKSGISFAILYGGNEWTVSINAGIPLEHATVMVENFFAGTPKLKAWIDSTIQTARREKKVKTYFGRVRHLDEFYKEEYLKDKMKRRIYFKGDREAVNSPIQGGGADIFKIALIKVHKLINERNWTNDVKHFLYMHDELVLRMRVSMLETMIPEIQKVMEFDVKNWPVKLETEAKVGWNWGREMTSLPKFLEMLKNKTSDVSVEEQDSEEEFREALKDHGYLR